VEEDRHGVDTTSEAEWEAVGTIGWVDTPGAERRLVLDEEAWLALCEALPVAPGLPEHPGFAVSWNPPDPFAGSDRRAAARRRLIGAGVLDRLGRPVAFLADALSGWSAAPLRVRVRSWLGAGAVWAEIGVGSTGGVGLARSARVDSDPAGRPVVADDGAGIELSFFPASAVARAVERALPEGVLDASDSVDHPAGAPWAWEEAISVAEALAGVGVSLTDPRQAEAADPVEHVESAAGSAAEGDDPTIREEILDGVLAAIKPHGPPPVGADLAARLSGAIDIRVDVASPGGRRRWRGLWLLSGRRLVAVLPAVGKPSVGHLVIGPPAGTQGADPATGGVSVGLVPVGGEQLRRDVLAAVTTAMGAAAG
jgi:hypothetical protein